MRFYKELYVSDNCIEKKNKICWKLKHHAGQLNIFVITLAPGNDLLEIYHCAYLQQRYYKRTEQFIIGIAGGYEEAIALSTKIIDEVYQNTGTTDVKRYFME
ncbi:MAG: hypothetical protein RRX92_03275 [Lachnospiraceae bacterium]